MKSEITLNSYVLTQTEDYVDVDFYEQLEKKFIVDDNRYIVVNEKGINQVLNISFYKRDKDYFFVCIKTGQDSYYSEDTYNTQKLLPENNPRAKEQVEMRKYNFIFCDLQADKQNRICYISHGGKKPLERIIAHFDLNAKVHEIKVDSIEQFLNSVNKVRDVRLVGSDNLFKESSSIYEETPIINGIGPSLQQYDLKLTLNLTGNLMQQFVRKLHSEYGQGKYKSLVIAGGGNSAFDSIFAEGAFTKKIKVDIETRLDEGEGEPEYELVIQEIKRKLGI